MKEVVMVSCRNNEQAQGYLTLHKIYDVISETSNGYLIRADHGHSLLYRKDRFKVVVTRVDVNPAEIWTL